MNIRFFTENPIFSGVISLGIVVLGVLAFFHLPVERYPDIAPPTVVVSATYPGAKAETVQKSVIAPLEEAINGVENINYITSSANNDGVATITVYFHQGTDADLSAVLIQNRVTTVSSILPAEVVRGGIVTRKEINSELKTVMLICPDDRYSEEYVDNYMSSIVVPRIERMPGVSRVGKFGSEYALRIWLKPEKMAMYSLVPDDIAAALDDQNIEAGTGFFGENSDNAWQYTLKYRGRLTTPEEFENIVLRSLPGGNVLRLGDVAEIDMGRQSYSILETAEGHHASGIAIYQAEGSNASATIKKLDAEFAQMSRELPAGLEFRDLNSADRFLNAAIWQVVWSFLLALALIIIVIYVFLQDFRATLIPALGVIVSVVGTFGFLYVAGFSINLLTLFALVLCIGTVVDDSIVVVEAVQEKLASGYTSRYKSTLAAMDNVTTAVIVTTVIFMSVFIPVSMMGGTAGVFYKQFGLTMAASVFISTFYALTFAPVLTTKLLRPYINKQGVRRQGFDVDFHNAFQAAFDGIVNRYKHHVTFFIRHKWISWLLLASSLVLLMYFVKTTRTSLVPQEDTSIVFVSTSTAPGTSLADNFKVLQRADSIFRTFPEIELCVEEAGYSFIGSGSNMGQFLILLKDWKYRKEKGMSADDVVSRFYTYADQLPELSMIAMQNSMIPGYSSGSNLEIYLQDLNDGGIGQFKEVTDQFVAALNARPEIEMAYSSFSDNYPQFWVDVDAAQCELEGISVREVLSTLGGYYGGSYVSNFNRFSRVYRVMVQAEPDSRVTPESLDHFFVRTPAGMAPLSRFVTLTKTYGAESLSRFNLYNSIQVSGSPAPGYSSGEAIAAVRETAQQFLPAGYGYEFGGISREESTSGNNIGLIIVICILLIYVILASLYESWVLPFVIILAVPFGLMGSFLFARIFGLENNIYLQTAVIMLIGLLAKTAILITDYAGKRRNEGWSLAASAVSASKERLRPILMTSLTMIIGMMPLMFARGAGAMGNATIGTGVVGGMLFGTIVMIFIVPALWVVFRYIHERIRPKWLKK